MKKELSGAVYVDQYCSPPTRDSGNKPVSITAITCGEIGGSNSMEPLIYGAYHDIVIVDCDEMGRAFPELQVVLFKQSDIQNTVDSHFPSMVHIYFHCR